jgi:Protein of unknown function (DUF3105)
MINRFTLAGLLAVLAVVGLGALAVIAVGGGSDSPTRPSDRAADTGAPPPADPAPSASAAPKGAAATKATPPAQKTKDLAKAVKLAGCILKHEPNEGVEHADREFSATDYQVNPPTSGTHAPTWAEDGIYGPGTTPPLGTLVHTLEHGRIDIQYKPGTPAKTITELTALYNELDGGYHLLLFENGTDMPFAVAATAWDQLLGCQKFNDRVFDAIRAFTATYVDQGPEVVP